MVGTDECPMVIGLLEAINIEQVYAQLKDEFYLWWDGVILGDPDMATHLQDQIDELTNRLNNSGVGLLTSAAYEVFKSGNMNMEVTNSTISDGAAADSLNNQYAMVYRTLLPDGKALCLSSSVTDNSSAYINIHACITNTNGVTNVKTFNITAPSDFPDVYDNGNAHMDTVFFVKKVETYPITAYCILTRVGSKSDYETGSDTGKPCMVVTMTITVDGAVNISTKGYRYNDGNIDLSSLGLRIATTNKAGDTAYLLAGKRGDFDDLTWVGIWAIIIDTNGVVTNDYKTLNVLASDSGRSAGLRSKNSSVIDTDDTNGRWISNKIYEYYTKDEGGLPKDKVNIYLFIDYNTKQLGAVKGSVYPGRTTLYSSGYNKYTASEADGFLKIEYVPNEDGTSLEEVTTKISDYYLGASNLGEALAEGDLVAVKNTSKSVYIAMGPNKEKICIGSNGGAAVLKSKFNITVPSYDNVVTEDLGYMEQDSVVRMLLKTNNVNGTIARYVTINTES